MTSDPDLHLAESLAARVRRDPAAFPDAARIAEVAGVGPAELDALFRHAFHAPPDGFLAREKAAAACRMLAGGASVADAADAVGYDSLSAFDEAFRRQTGMAPGDYGRLGASPEFIVALPADYRTGEMLQHAGRDGESRSERLAGTELVKALRLADVPARLYVRVEGGAARCRVESPRTLPPEAVWAAHGVVVRVLGLGSDAAGFERHAAGRPELARLAARRPGLRVPLTADPFEAMVWVIVGQQVNLAFAYALRRVVVELAGEDAGDGFRAHPSAEAVAALDYADLTARRFSRRKAEYVIDTARLVASGELPLDALAEAPAPRIAGRLLAVRGLGPWSVQYLLMRAFGFEDCVPLGDAGLTAALRRFHALDHRPGPAETAALMEPFAPYRSLATFHLWATLGDPA